MIKFVYGEIIFLYNDLNFTFRSAYYRREKLSEFLIISQLLIHDGDYRDGDSVFSQYSRRTSVVAINSDVLAIKR